MGLVLDSGVLIAAERDARPVSELPYAVGTRNLRHFQMIPDLAIVQLL